MRLTYHRNVQRDVNRILKHYDASSSRLGDEFWTELTGLIDVVSRTPKRFHFDGSTGFRRANLNRFPYNVLYKIVGDTIRILVVRHNKRHPKFGAKRL
jgi:toxin ParE1/3/4